VEVEGLADTPLFSLSSKVRAREPKAYVFVVFSGFGINLCNE